MDEAVIGAGDPGAKVAMAMAATIEGEVTVPSEVPRSVFRTSGADDTATDAIAPSRRIPGDAAE